MKNTLIKICFLIEEIYNLLQKVPFTEKETLEKGTKPQEPNLSDSKLLDIEQVRTILGIGRTTYYRFVNSGKLIPRKIGNRHCYYLQDLEEMIQESKFRGRV